MPCSNESWLRRSYQRIPFFVQCLVSYLLIMMLFFAALFLVSNRTRDIARQNYLNERNYALETSAKSFSRQLSNFRAIPLALQRTPYYMQLRLLSPEKINMRHYYAMNSLRVSFSQQCTLLEMENEAFMYLQNSGAVIGNRSNSFDAFKFFAESVRFDQKSPSEVVDFLSSFGGTQMLHPCQRMSGQDIAAGDYLLFLYRREDESAVYGLLLGATAIENLFRLSELPPGATLELVRGDTLLFSSDVSPETTRTRDERLEYPLPVLNLTVRLGIPESYFSELTASLTSLNRTYILVTLCVGLALSVLLSMVGQMPVRRLLRISSCAPENHEIRNEFLALGETIVQSMNENEQLRTQIDSGKLLLRLNLLARLLAQESYTAQDESLAAEHLPQLSRPSRILCLQLITAERENELSDFVSFHAMECVQKLYSPRCLMVQMRRDLFALLVHDDENTRAWVTEAALALQENLNHYGAALNAGLSESFAGLDALHGAYLHACFTLRYFSPPIPVFQPAENTEPFRFVDLSRFQNAVQGCEENAAHTQLDRLLDSTHHSAWVPKALHFILDSICTEMNLPLIDQNAPLHMRTSSVIYALTAQKDEYANTLLETILQYLNDNFADSSLSVDSVSLHFGVSKSYLYRAFRESLGITLNDKLEQIRMAHANELLITTKLSVNAVAAACGYNSANTFYKVYKKCFNRSPNATRPSVGMPAETTHN